MTDSRYTPTGLPKISEGVVEVMERDIERSIREMPQELKDDYLLATAEFGALMDHDPDFQNYVTSLTQKIALGEGPFKGLADLIKEAPGMGIFMGFTLCYEIMNRAAEGYKLEDSVNSS